MNAEQLARLPEVLFEIGKIIGSDEKLSVLLGRIAELVCKVVNANAVSVMILDRGSDRLLGAAAHGLPKDRIAQLSFRVGEGIAGWVVENGEPVVIPDVTKDERFIVLPQSKTNIGSMVCVPLVARDESVGVLTATSPQLEEFGDADIEVLTFIARTIALDIQNARLRKLSVTDALTGAFNREFLQHRLPAEIAEANESNTPLSVAMVDIDHFKNVNDRHGHDIGDKVLIEVANRLRSAIRNNDLLVRYGGEEFLVVLPSADIERAADVGDRMRRRVASEEIRCDGSHRKGDDKGDHKDIIVEVRVSVGVAQLRPDESEANLVRRADTALYSAKGRGRNRVERG